MKKFAIAAAAIAAVGFVSAASAADMPTKAPMAPLPVAFNWTGVYVGINGGGGWGRENWIDNSAAAIVSISHDPRGGVFGGQLGYRYQWNQLVLGVEGTWDWAGLRDTAVAGAFTEEFKVKSIYTVTGQAGWAWDRWLLYVKGGWAGATTNLNLGGAGFSASNSQTANGWTIGGGFDYAVWQNWILGVEYDHFDLNYGTFSAPASPFGTLIVTNTSRLTIDQVVARLSYKFDWPR
ncbi:MAG TPA: outer membrane beta-barrel protein [Pseudolabrys sp.]|jgi:outer membrane immunogenic protein